MEEEAKQQELLKKREMEESERRLALASQEMERDIEQRMVVARATYDLDRKRALQQFAIENCDLVKKRTKAVFDVLNTLKGCDLIHPSLMASAIGSISNMAAELAGVGQSSTVDQEPTHLEDFSTMIRKMGNPLPDLKQLSAIGKLVATEYRNRYGGQKPDHVMKQVNGAIRPVNVYETKDRDWIEAIVREYTNSIVEQ